MTLEWDKNVKEGQIINKKLPPRSYTIQSERFCPYCNCPKSHVTNLQNIKELLKTKRVQFLLDHLNSKDLKIFTSQELIKSLGAELLTDGNLQNRLMTILCCYGLYNRIRQEYIEERIVKNKIKKFERFRYIYTKNWSQIKPKCYDLDKDRHIPLKEEQFVRKTYFDDKAQEQEGNDGRNS